MSDLLLRGRGADRSVRAPTSIIRACGAALALAITFMADALGIWNIVGVPAWTLHMVALAAGAFVAPTAFGIVLWWVSGTCALVLMLVMYTPLVRPLTTPFIRADVVENTPVDAVMVLSGSLTDDGRIKGQALDRLLTALTVSKQRAIPEFALSVVTVQGRSPVVSSEADQLALMQLVAPELTPRFVRDVHSTRDEALAFAALSRTHGWHHVIVVTSPMHSRRTCRTMEKAGLLVECRPAAPRDYSVVLLDRGASRRLAFQDVLYEATATMVYALRGWI